MCPARFCVVFLAASVALAATVAAFNAIVDPYAIFDAPRHPGFNARTPAVATRERMMKAYQAPRVSARAVILGSSRTDLGLDPASAAWPAQVGPVYNLSLVGDQASTGLKYLRHMMASSPGGANIHTLVVGLDFEAFLFKPAVAGPVPVEPVELSEIDERLLVDASGQPNPRRSVRVLTDQAIALLSLDALGDSAATIAASRSLTGADLLPNGKLADTPFRHNMRDDGAMAVFDQKNSQTVAQYAAPHRMLSEAPNGPIRHLHAVREILALAKVHGMTVILAVQPAHVSRLELLDRMGYWDDYERWKRALAALVAGETAAGRAVALWDFGGYEPYAQEEVPAKSARQAMMKWFWDPVHYTSALGDVMLARMFGPSGDAGYGIRLTPENVEARLAAIRTDRAVFRATNPVETARLAALCGRACPAPAVIAPPPRVARGN